ncbi:hypothetical protein JCM10908_000123 [Rhodotorula pacifica]|uniref:uncharacterized protein n=1 Tax=Rhodotorula pacifica TaxID=1495444 RepID=UPI00316E28D7
MPLKLFQLDLERDHELCAAVIEETENYRQRPPLGVGPVSAAEARFATGVLRQLQDELKDAYGLLLAQALLAGEHDMIGAAGDDWFERNRAVFLSGTVPQWLHEGHIAVHVYFQVLEELNRDLRHYAQVAKYWNGQTDQVMAQPQLHWHMLHAAAVLLARTPTLVLERLRQVASIPCPEPLWRRSWEQPALLPFTRYAPLIHYPAPAQLPHPALPWSGAVLCVMRTVNSAVRGVLARQQNIADHDQRVLGVPQETMDALAWLRSQPGEQWYERHLDNQQRSAFCELLTFIAAECQRVSLEDGCFIALNYAMTWTPSLVQGWMEHSSQHSQFPLAPFPATTHYYSTTPLDPMLWCRFESFGTASHGEPMAGHHEQAGGMQLEMGARSAVRYRKAGRRW